jgi:hypothetical protein
MQNNPGTLLLQDGSIGLQTPDGSVMPLISATGENLLQGMMQQALADGAGGDGEGLDTTLGIIKLRT